MWRRIKKCAWLRRLLGFEETIWTRKVADAETRKLIAPLDPASMRVLEISGAVWAHYGFKFYHNVGFPDFDICRDTLPAQYDLIIMEHVLEHVLEPTRALVNARTMLADAGHLLVVTPFLYKVHPCPHDQARWTRAGLEHLLTGVGFREIVTASWGNRSCFKATMRKEFILFNRYLHSTKNEPDYPIVVWALARK